MAHQTLFCLGTGGVGKTTIAAALGLAAARQNHRVLLLTIDPARRLAQALGLTLGQQSQHTIAKEKLAPFGVQHGSMTVHLLDVGQTFQQLLAQLAPNAQVATSIANHPLYNAFIGAISGSHEYAAITQLYDAIANPDYDVVVLDTPPAQNALLFLDAPEKVLQFIRQNTIQWLLRQAGFASRWSNPFWDIGGKLFMKLFDKLAGAATLRDLVALLGLVQELTPALEQRASLVQQQLQEQAIDLWLISGSQREQQTNAEAFVTALQTRGMTLTGCVLNRLQPPAPDHKTQEQLERALKQLALPQLPILTGILSQWQQDRQLELELELRWRQLWHIPIFTCPKLPEQSDGLANIAQIADHLQSDQILQPFALPLSSAPKSR